MKTKEFLSLLENNPEAGLTFEYEKGRFVPDTYHITEVKNVTIDSVDCGGNADSYKQTIVQLWVPKNEQLRKPWTAKKALSIFGKVDQMTPMVADTEIFFEFGNDEIRTSNFSVEAISREDDKIAVQLYVQPTVCKPQLAGEASCC